MIRGSFAGLAAVVLAAWIAACASVPSRPDGESATDGGETETRPWDVYLDSDLGSAEARRKFFDFRRALLQDFYDSGNLVRAAATSRRHAEWLADSPVGDFALQDLAAWELILGNYETALSTYPPRKPLYKKPVPDGFDDLVPKDALEAVVEASHDQQAVFINEWHHIAQLRALTLRLLPELRRLGFTHFAAEALTHDDPELAARGYPMHGKTSLYVHEPVFGDVVRTALELGFVVVPYEFAGPAKEREPGQAQRLFDATLAKDPDARILVHAGMGHTRRQESWFGVGTMLWNFEQISGVRTLTIDQLSMTERARDSEESPIYRHFTASQDFDAPVVLETADGAPFQIPHFDLVVFSPRVQQVAGRPHWLRMDGARRDVPLPDDPCGAASHCLVEARVAPEPDEAIPVDRVEVWPNDDELPVLVLPPGDYRLRSVDAEGEEIRQWSLEVPAESAA